MYKYMFFFSRFTIIIARLSRASHIILKRRATTENVPFKLNKNNSFVHTIAIQSAAVERRS